MRLKTIPAMMLGASTLVVAALAGMNGASAQSLADVQVPDEPLTLQSKGSFYIGGELSEKTPTQLSSGRDAPPVSPGRITVNQMYVEFMVPAEASGVPVVMMHGGTVTGKSYDTTPDGRMGWYEYFVRQGHPVYVPDQVGRARSGIDLSVYNDVRAGVVPPTELGNTWRHADELNWTAFRFGPEFGTPFEDSKFPLEALDEFSKQAVPDLSGNLPDPNPNIAAMAELGNQLDGAILMGHSQTGALPLQAALANPAAAKGLVLIEPGFCISAQLTEAEIATLAGIPIMVVFGDNVDLDTRMPNFTWQMGYDDCLALIDRLEAAGGNAQMLYPPDRGITGNSHMIMQDTNSHEIADIILGWIGDNAGVSATVSE